VGDVFVFFFLVMARMKRRMRGRMLTEFVNCVLCCQDSAFCRAAQITQRDSGCFFEDGLTSNGDLTRT
jgi:hypothetical protein